MEQAAAVGRDMLVVAGAGTEKVAELIIAATEAFGRGEALEAAHASDAAFDAAVVPPKASTKGRFDFDRAMYGWRHLIENTFAKLKEFRAVATRYDKTDTSYAAVIHLAAAVIASR